MKPSNMLVSLHKVGFSRRNSYFTFFLDDLAEESFGMAELYLGGSRYSTVVTGRNKLFKVTLLHEGVEVPYAVSSTPAELVLDSDYGTVRFCIAESQLIRVQATGGVGVRFFADLTAQRDEVRDLLDGGAFGIYMRHLGNWVFAPISGRLQVAAPWNWRRTRSDSFRADFLPEGDGPMEFAIEEFIEVEDEGFKRKAYPEYAAAVQAVQRDFDAFLAMVPEFKDSAYQSVRTVAAWTSWVHLVDSIGLIQRPMMMMMRRYFPRCFAWQQSYQAIALSGDIQLAWQLLLSMFDFQRENGAIPDFVFDSSVCLKVGKPPFQGLALLWLMEHADFGQITAGQVEQLYAPLARWTEWWFNCRNPDGDGIPQYNNPDEAGWDDATIFIGGGAVKSPDLSAFLVLQMEALGKLAEKLGRGAEAESWQARSQALLETLLGTFWDGERFVSIQAKTGKKLTGDSIVCYQPIILGHRLPADVIAKVAAALAKEGEFLTPYGLASEKLSSPYMDPLRGWMDGPVISPVQFMFVIGLADAGQKALAAEVARRYCNTLAKTGMHHIHNPFNGQPQTKGRDFQIQQPWTSWCSATFLTLAAHYC